MRRRLPTQRLLPFVAALVAAACVSTDFAHAQCSYPVLSDDVPQTFATTPAFARFVQSAPRWAAAGVRSSGTANWDVGFSTGTMVFPQCVTLPVVASQQTSGIDFVLGDFGTQGTGTRHAPIARVSGSGSGTLEWDSGSRTASIGVTSNIGVGGSNLLDCWNVDLVAGTSYAVLFFGDSGNLSDFTLYAFQRGGANTWRQKSDAVLTVPANLSGPHVFTPTTTGRHAIVVVNETGGPDGYEFFLQTCTTPISLSSGAEQAVPLQPGKYVENFSITPNVPGFPTVAFRATIGSGSSASLGVGPRSAPGALPPCDYVSVNSHDGSAPVRVVVGDFASGVLTLGNTYWLGVYGPYVIGPDSWIEFDAGNTPLNVNGAPHSPVFAEHDIVHTYRADLTAGQDVTVHVGNCAESAGRLQIYRPFDSNNPSGQGWSTATHHPPLASVALTGVHDFTFSPPVTGPYAFVLTKEGAGAGCFELGLSTCQTRLNLTSGVGTTLTANPSLAYAGEAYATRHGLNDRWSVIAVRSYAANEDWNVAAFDDPSGGGGGPPLGCFGGQILTTNDPGFTSDVDFLVRREQPLADPSDRIGSFRVFPVDGASPGGGGVAEYEAASSSIVVGAPPTNWAMSSLDVIGVWDVDLVTGQSYEIAMNGEGTAAELFLFKSAGTCPSFCTPEFKRLGGEELRTRHDTSYVAPATGTYGIVIANQIGSSLTTTFAVSLANIGIDPVEPGVLTAPRFDAVVPNPSTARGMLQFAYALPRPARVAFEIVNLAGRIVARMDDADSPAGANRRAWTAVATEGQTLAPGVYFVRMIVDGQAIARKKLALAH